MARILFDNLSSALDVYCALAHIYYIGAVRSCGRGNYECHCHCPCSVRPFIPFAAQCKSSRGAAWNMHRSPLIIMQPDNARVRTRTGISISLLLKIKPTNGALTVLCRISRSPPSYLPPLSLCVFHAKVLLMAALILILHIMTADDPIIVKLLLFFFIFFCALIYLFKLLLQDTT